jgi:hypothetical protein
VFGRERVGGGRSGAGTQASRDVDFPGDVDAALPTLRVRGLRNGLFGRRVETGSVIEAARVNADAWIQP